MEAVLADLTAFDSSGSEVLAGLTELTTVFWFRGADEGAVAREFTDESTRAPVIS
jgi:hypothetical protein